MLRDVAKVWMSLESRAEGSFFTSWTWIGAWLATLEAVNFPPGALRLLEARAGDTVVGLAVLATGPSRWRSAGRTPLFLHQTGRPEFDAIYVEYNDILVAADQGDTVRRACLDYVQALPGRLRIQAAVGRMAHGLGQSDIPHRAFRQERCDYIDLMAATAAQGGVLAVDSSNARQQIARGVRRAETRGPVVVHRAQTVAAAEQDLSDLIALHAVAWQTRKGRPGAFANPFVREFVTRLVRTGAGTGAVDLLRITAGAETLGILLNLVHRGEVYAYQSGFAYTDDNRDKPGLVSHALAAAYYKARGLRAYHFMAGAARYKTSLSNADETLTWVETFRDDALTRAAHAAEALWRRLRGAQAPAPNFGGRR